MMISLELSPEYRFISGQKYSGCKHQGQKNVGQKNGLSDK